nr:hypothetical protein [Saprospiraceae bacterium]
MFLVRSFSANLALRILFLVVLIAAAAAAATLQEPRYGLAFVLSGAVILVAFNLFHYVNDTNRRLARFFES